ncbi:MAG: DNA polymerase III subunit alpha [candidate division Zixibacteria bacterium]|nr:DNA polymerase III subunit alpha [candidate division Zixibacteria bacterium]
MKYSNFVHLHTHSQYSLLDGACRLDDVIEVAKEYKMPALAITDHGNMFGAIEFYIKAKSAGIKPIIGCETYVAAGSRFDKKPSSKYPDGGFHLVLLVKNETGYRNLMKLSSMAFLEGFYYRPRIDKQILKEYSDGLIATSACLKGEVNWHLLNGDTETAASTAREYLEIFGEGNFFLELQNHGLEKEQILIPKIDAIARETGIPLVVTNDCHYLNQKDAEAHDALLCIQTGKFVSDNNRMKYNSDQIYFKSADEMEHLFGDFKTALENTVKIAEKCNLELELGKLKLPIFPIPKSFANEDKFLRHLCEEGLNERYAEITEEITQRLDYELNIIRQMGYAGYFMIVKDFCDYAKQKKIPVGPGRGSAAGSLVSYCLKITNVDPIKFGLLFERFLNPERISMPDIDIDFSDRGREQIIQYVIEKYGKDNVCQIITFGTMAARGVIRDVGRVLSIPYGEVDEIAKMIPEGPGVTLKAALKKVPELKELQEKDPKINKLLSYAQTLEGLARHCSTHAAGVVIAPSALTNYVPLFKGSKDEITTQYDMKMVDRIGLLKMDFLGLRTLTVIDDTLRLVKENHGKEIDIDNVPLDDSEVYRIFARGNTIGVFQFESSGMRDYLRKLNPTTFTDITAMNALYRPGPLDSGMINTYIECRHGQKKIEFLHPVLKEILGDTYGVIVFQEQVLKIANNLAGYSLGKADLLRKAMGKKDANLMAQQKKEFLEGADKKKIDRKISEEVFNQIETFARYGFNKAHSTCYAFIAYQTAWLKYYYPQEFMAALMTSEINSADRIYTMLEECKRMGIEVLPPDINESGVDFSVLDKKIRFGLKAVKNVGENPAKAIVDSREKEGKYSNLPDLVTKLPLRSINRRTLESLISAGACDNLDGGRAAKHKAVESMLEYAHKITAHSNSHDLFASGGAVIKRVAPPLPEVNDWSKSEKLNHEKEMLGFYISGHPLDTYRDTIISFTTHSLGNIGEVTDGREVTVGGIIANVKKMTDKKGNLMAFVTLEDYNGTVELIIFSKCYDKNKDFIEEDQMVLITGRVSTREEEAAKIIVSEVIALNKLTENFNCQLVIKVSENNTDKMINDAINYLENYKGQTPVMFAATISSSEVYIKSKRYSVDIDLEMLRKLKELLGESSAYLRPMGK